MHCIQILYCNSHANQNVKATNKTIFSRRRTVDLQTGVSKPGQRHLSCPKSGDAQAKARAYRRGSAATLRCQQASWSNHTEIHYESAADKQKEIRHSLLHAHSKHEAYTGALSPRLSPLVHERIR